MDSISGLGFSEVECNTCHHLVRVFGVDVDVNPYEGYDGARGPVMLFRGTVDIDCPKCSNHISVSYNFEEFLPRKITGGHFTQAVGAKVIRSFPKFQIDFEDKFYTLENYVDEFYPKNRPSLLHLPQEKKIITSLCLGVSDLLHEVNEKPDIIYKVSPRGFEELIAHIFSLHGFTVELTSQTRDGGRDIIAVRSDLGIKSKWLIECKRYALTNSIGVELVRALYGVQVQERANKSVLATTSRFTPDARKFARTTNTTEWAMDLKDAKNIRAWVKSAANK